MQLGQHVGGGLLSSFFDGVSCNPDWLWTGCAADLGLLIPPAVISQALEVQVCAIIPSLCIAVS